MALPSHGSTPWSGYDAVQGGVTPGPETPLRGPSVGVVGVWGVGGVYPPLAGRCPPVR